MSKQLEKIKNLIFEFKYIAISIVIIVLLLFINNKFWKPVINKEKERLNMQSRNQQMLKEREESKLQMTSNGVYFLPSGSKKTNNTTKKTNKTSVNKNNTNNNNNPSYSSKVTEKIEEKIEYFYQRMIKIEKNDTSEVKFSKKKVYSPFYKNDSKTVTKSIKYVPDYIVKDIIYKGYYVRGGSQNAIVKYDRLYYLKKGEALKDTTLSVKNISDNFLTFVDNKTGEEVVVNK